MSTVSTKFPGVFEPVTAGSDKAWAPITPFGHSPYTWSGAPNDAPTNTNSAVLGVFPSTEAPEAAAEPAKAE